MRFGSTILHVRDVERTVGFSERDLDGFLVERCTPIGGQVAGMA